MKEAISLYEAPDLSEIEADILVAQETIETQNTTIKAQDTAIESLQTIIESQRETINRIDGDQQMLFTDFRAIDKRVYELERDTGQELIDIRKSIREQIEEALANPLANQ